MKRPRTSVNTHDHRSHVSRRTFLWGAGTALPWMESLPARSAETGKLAAQPAASKPPVRFACVYFSNGVEPAHWWAKGRGASMEIGPGLRPMEPLREDMVFVRGLFNQQAVQHKSAHLGRMPNLLSGAWVTEDQNDLRVGKTMDQVLARQLGQRTDIPSLVLGIEPTELRLEDGLSQMNFGFLDGVRGSLHLDLTHNGHDPQLEAMYLKTNQFHVQQFAYLVKRLKEIDEGEQSLLDSSLLLCCSNLFDGDKHQADQMPMLLAGRGGGSLETGRILDYLDAGEDNRRACSLYLSLMDRMGVRLNEFGDTNRRLAGL